MIDPKAAEDAIAAVRADIELLDQDTMNATVGIAQALDQLTRALEDVSECVDQRKYQQAADLGYRSVASEFIFLQRVLGDINTIEHRKGGLVQDLAIKLRCAYEDIAPHVDALMTSMKPRGPITLADAIHHEAMVAKIREKYGPHLTAADVDDDDEEHDDDWGDDEAEIRKVFDREMSTTPWPGKLVEPPTVAKEEPEDDEPPRTFDFARSVGFGREGWRKATALSKARAPAPTQGQILQFTEETWQQLTLEAHRLNVTAAQLVHAAIGSWLASNPKSAKSGAVSATPTLVTLPASRLPYLPSEVVKHIQQGRYSLFEITHPKAKYAVKTAVGDVYLLGATGSVLGEQALVSLDTLVVVSAVLLQSDSV